MLGPGISMAATPVALLYSWRVRSVPGERPLALLGWGMSLLAGAWAVFALGIGSWIALFRSG
jgi:hypothetical protein